MREKKKTQKIETAAVDVQQSVSTLLRYVQFTVWYLAHVELSTPFTLNCYKFKIRQKMLSFSVAWLFIAHIKSNVYDSICH